MAILEKTPTILAIMYVTILCYGDYTMALITKSDNHPADTSAKETY